MKRTILFLLVTMTTFSCLFAQTAKNPFSQLGYKKHIYYTSSKGEFEEFHDNADIVEIGSVYFNTKTKKVVGYVNEEKENAEVATATPAMSVDPLCEKYYWITPYAYCLNNPVSYIDPDGRFVMSAAMQKAYPKLTENMQRIATEWSGKSTQFKDALIKSSGLNEKQITDMLTFGKGPELNVENLDTETSKSNGRTFLTKSSDGKIYNIGNGKISLDNDVVNMLESAQTPIDNAAGNIMIESTVLHEITHVGNAQTTNTGNGNFTESGKNFEVSAYGMDISRSNVRSFAEKVTPQIINAKIPQIQVTPTQIPVKIQLP